MPPLDGRYRVILADPPWNLRGGKKNTNKLWSKTASPDAHYQLMTTEMIGNIRVQNIAAADSFLFLWAVNGLLPDGLEVMERWGFRYVTNICWRKTTGYGLGQYVRGDHELCLFGVRGRPGYTRDITGKKIQVRSVVDAPRGRHSEKPEEMRRIIERMSPGPYVELFSRKQTPGWDVWGNQVTSAIDLPLLPVT